MSSLAIRHLAITVEARTFRRIYRAVKQQPGHRETGSRKTQTNFETFSVSGSGTFTAGNPADTYDYDYGVGSAGALLRHIHYDYLHSPNSAYLAANIIGKPVSKYVYDGAGNMAAKTIYGYDSHSLTSITGATNHDDQNFGTGNQVRGNLTTVSEYTDSSNAVVKNLYYDTRDDDT